MAEMTGERAAEVLENGWLVWSNEHNAWWGQNGCGYYYDIHNAGRYTLEDAKKHEARRSHVKGELPPELIYPSPELQEALTHALAAMKEREELRGALTEAYQALLGLHARDDSVAGRAKIRARAVFAPKAEEVGGEKVRFVVGQTYKTRRSHIDAQAVAETRCGNYDRLVCVLRNSEDSDENVGVGLYSPFTGNAHRGDEKRCGPHLQDPSPPAFAQRAAEEIVGPSSNQWLNEDQVAAEHDQAVSRIAAIIAREFEPVMKVVEAVFQYRAAPPGSTKRYEAEAHMLSSLHALDAASKGGGA